MMFVRNTIIVLYALVYIGHFIMEMYTSSRTHQS